MECSFLPPTYASSACEVLELRQECSFLRIEDHSWHFEAYRKLPQHGTVATLRFQVHGLPRVKRPKWLQPLSRSIMSLLQRCGCMAKMHNSEVYVPFANGEFLRLEFVGTKASFATRE